MHLNVPANDLGELRWSGVGVVNLEGPVCAAVPAGEGVRLGNGPGAPARLSQAGVAVVGVANNHAADAGPEGVARTRAALAAAGLSVAAPGPALVYAGRHRVAVAQYDLADGPPDLRPLLDAPAGYRVATFHVTGPPSYLPRPELRAAVEAALAGGVDVVASHGTHAVGPVERRGRQIIAWGLGNYAFDCACTRDDEGLVLVVELGDRPRAWVHPIRAGLGGEPPRRAPDAAAMFELLAGIGSSALRPDGGRAEF